MYAEDLMAKIDKLSEEQKSILLEIEKGRAQNYSQPLSLISSKSGHKDTGPFTSLGDFLSVIKQAGGNPMAHPKVQGWVKAAAAFTKTLPTGMNETVGSDGGVLVPPVWANTILHRTYGNDLLSRTTMFPLSTGNSIQIPAVNESSRADGSQFGGVTAYWRSEAGTITTSKPSLMNIQLVLDSLTAAAQTTQELLDDAPAMEAFINMVVPQVLAFKIGDSIVNGDGVTKPLGIMKSPAKITVSKQSGQAAGTLTARNINEMWSRLWWGCRDNAVWLYDQSIEPALDEMTIGTAGAQMAVYLPPGGLSAQRYGTIKGRPAIPVEFCQQLGTEGDIILTDLSTYLTATKGGVQTAASLHVYFLTNEQVFRWVMRMDGKPWWLTALTPKSGGPTQSCIVTLQTRA